MDVALTSPVDVPRSPPLPFSPPSPPLTMTSPTPPQTDPAAIPPPAHNDMASTEQSLPTPTPTSPIQPEAIPTSTAPPSASMTSTANPSVSPNEAVSPDLAVDSNVLNNQLAETRRELARVQEQLRLLRHQASEIRALSQSVLDNTSIHLEATRSSAAAETSVVPEAPTTIQSPPAPADPQDSTRAGESEVNPPQTAPNVVDGQLPVTVAEQIYTSAATEVPSGETQTAEPEQTTIAPPLDADLPVGAANTAAPDQATLDVPENERPIPQEQVQQQPPPPLTSPVTQQEGAGEAAIEPAEWADIEEDTSAPDEDETKEIEAAKDVSARDVKHHEEYFYADAPEDPEQQPLQKMRLTWIIKGLRGTKEKPNRARIMNSPAVQVGGFYWYLKFFPRGNNSSALSAYVKCSRKEPTPDEEVPDNTFSAVYGPPDADLGELKPAVEMSISATGGEPGRKSEHGDEVPILEEGSKKPAETDAVRPEESANASANTEEKTVRKEDADEDAEDWRVSAQIGIIIYNPDEPRTKFDMAACHQFNKHNDDWGWTNFHGPWSEIHKRKQGQRQALLRSDTLALDAYIRVFNDPSQALWWHQCGGEEQWDSLSLTGYPAMGTKNYHTTSVAGITPLLLLAPFRRIFQELKTDGYRTSSDVRPQALCSQLQMILYLMRKQKKDEKFVSLEAITEIIEKIDESGTDVVTFWEGIRRSLELELGSNPNAIEQLADLFDGGRPENSTRTRSSVLKIPVENIGSVHSGLEQVLAKSESKKFFPKFLSVELERQKFDTVTREWKMSYDRVRLDEELDLSKWSAEPDTAKYTLYGFVVHLDERNSGKFYSILRPHGPGSKWLAFEDGTPNQVISYTKHRIQEFEGLEGEALRENKAARQTAYLAMYIRSDLLKDFLPGLLEPYELSPWLKNCPQVRDYLDSKDVVRYEEETRNEVKLEIYRSGRLAGLQGMIDIHNLKQASTPEATTTVQYLTVSADTTYQELRHKMAKWNQIDKVERIKMWIMQPPSPGAPLNCSFKRIFKLYKTVTDMDWATQPHCLWIHVLETDDLVKSFGDPEPAAETDAFDRTTTDDNSQTSETQETPIEPTVAPADPVTSTEDGVENNAASTNAPDQTTDGNAAPIIPETAVTSDNPAPIPDALQPTAPLNDAAVISADTVPDGNHGNEPDSGTRHVNETVGEISPAPTPTETDDRNDTGPNLHNPTASSTSDLLTPAPASSVNASPESNEQSDSILASDQRSDGTRAPASSDGAVNSTTVPPSLETPSDEHAPPSSTAVIPSNLTTENAEGPSLDEQVSDRTSQQGPEPTSGNSIIAESSTSLPETSESHATSRGQVVESPTEPLVDTAVEPSNEISNETPSETPSETLQEQPPTTETTVEATVTHATSAEDDALIAALITEDLENGVDSTVNTADDSSRPVDQDPIGAATVPPIDPAVATDDTTNESPAANEAAPPPPAVAQDTANDDAQSDSSLEEETAPRRPVSFYYGFIQLFDAEKQTFNMHGDFFAPTSDDVKDFVRKHLGYAADKNFLVWRRSNAYRLTTIQSSTSFSDIKDESGYRQDGFILVVGEVLSDSSKSALTAISNFHSPEPLSHYLWFSSRNHPVKACTGHTTISSFGLDYYSGNLLKGLYSGQGEHITPTGHSYKGPFLAGLRSTSDDSPEGVCVYSNGDEYTGGWASNEKHGKGIFVEKRTGNKYVGGYQDGKRWGQGITYWEVADEEGEMCQICYSEGVDSLFYDCGHVCACVECAKQVEVCPICRKSIKQVVKIWKA